MAFLRRSYWSQNICLTSWPAIGVYLEIRDPRRSTKGTSLEKKIHQHTNPHLFGPLILRLRSCMQLHPLASMGSCWRKCLPIYLHLCVWYLQGLAKRPIFARSTSFTSWLISFDQCVILMLFCSYTFIYLAQKTAGRYPNLHGMDGMESVWCLLSWLLLPLHIAIFTRFWQRSPCLRHPITGHVHHGAQAESATFRTDWEWLEEVRVELPPAWPKAI